MRIQYLNGGLANQTFQYIFYRYAQLRAPEYGPWYLDDSFFWVKKQHNGYELEKVYGVKPNLLSQEFAGEWDSIVEAKKNGGSVPETLRRKGLLIDMVAEDAEWPQKNPFAGKVYPIPCNGYYPEILRVPGENIYYHGYWINKEWMNFYRDVFLSELSLQEPKDTDNRRIWNRIENTQSVGVHVRRGDFVTLNWFIGETFYSQAVSQIRKEYPDAVYYLFSDEVEWCEAHYAELGLSDGDEIEFVKGNVNGTNHIDLFLMSKCRGLIMSNSSFSYLAALLNKGLEFFVNPSNVRLL